RGAPLRHGPYATARAVRQPRNLQADQRECHAVRAPYIKRVAAHAEKLRYRAHVIISIAAIRGSRSRMMRRTRAIAVAMLYIQAARAMSSMPTSMSVAMRGALVKLTDAP